MERSTHLREEFGGGSLTSLPIVETEAGNISAYIPTNIISITDGQIYLSTSQFQKGILPAIDTGKSVSRVGGDAQLPAYSALVGRLKLFYSQFEELESFAKFGTQLDKETERRLNRGRAIRSVMKQIQYRPIHVVEQIAILMATNKGLLDNLNDEQKKFAIEKIRASVRTDYPEIVDKILDRKKLKDDDKAILLDGFKKMLKQEGLNLSSEE
ncbi:MAG: ATP synthase subunit alpha [Alphaproteobacteria bacterium ADurb.Bin438]|nr:MAG: ATP synthase subunit alpha [Alphaproteobacteria bacterium ADurb.Bin438]